MANFGPICRFGAAPDEEESERLCWICFGTDEDDRLATWVHPCRCSGSTKWVHHNCVYCWIDEKLKTNPNGTVVCPQCLTEYIIVLPDVSRLAVALAKVDYVVRSAGPYIIASIILGSVYWTATTYGAITVLQVLGVPRGVALMENTNPILLMVGLPLIPVGLLLSRLIRWEDAVLRVMWNSSKIMRKIPLVKWITRQKAETNESNNGLRGPEPLPSFVEPSCTARLFCGAIFLPTVATILGHLLFKEIDNPLHQTLLGGVTYIGIKGILKIYLGHKQYLRRRRRHIVNYTEENVRTYVIGRQST